MEFKTKKVIINDVEYTLQKLPVREAFKLRDSWLINGQINQEKMYDKLLEHIVVAPKVKLDDFEDLETVEEIGVAALNFVYGSKTKN